ncbi:MAG: SGNH/GDSL hydrolase family protein [Actinomycetota bacterium]|nr:SGNH/GDSL hydrolase family protein [Actinomycetota bacterium]
MHDRGERIGLPAATVLAAATMTGFLGVAGVTWAAIRAQAKDATRSVEDAAVQAAVAAGAIPAGAPSAGDIPPLGGDGVYRPDGSAVVGEPAGLTLTMLGDSTSVGYGCATSDELPGVLLARRTAAALQLPVRLSTHGRVGAMSVELDAQLASAIEQGPEVAVIVIGANDITGQVPPHRAARWLGAAVAALRAQGIEVVVATCPDFGVIAPIPQPLRTLVTRWSHRLAVLQERAVRDADGIAVPIGRLVSPGFRGRPDLFYADGFHPSAAGYARAVDVMIGDVVAGAMRALSERGVAG